jgi:type II secretory pathway pseudopilin PulG
MNGKPTQRMNTAKLHAAGFTLMEVLVSFALFSIVVTVSVGTLIVLIDANNKAQETREVMTQVSSVLDAMSREIRTGYNYVCDSNPNVLRLGNNNATPDDCPGDTGFAFTESGGSLSAGAASNRIGYRLGTGNNSGRILRNVGNTSWQPITPDNVDITNLRFTLTGADRTDDLSPLVTIIIEGTMQRANGAASDFSLQTTVTQRLLDV